MSHRGVPTRKMFSLLGRVSAGLCCRMIQSWPRGKHEPAPSLLQANALSGDMLCLSVQSMCIIQRMLETCSIVGRQELILALYNVSF